MLLKNSDIKIMPAKHNDLLVVSALLKDASLPYTDIETHFNHFIIAKMEDEIIGIIGMEVYEDVALVRSFLVVAKMRKNGIGLHLFQQLIHSAKTKKIQTLFLLTETAENFFEKNGFQKIERKNIPMEISNTNEFKTYCASTAILMQKNI